jgi:tRNA dimethylallyltransferase
VAALPPLIAIVGPTAAGKSALALELALDRSGEIVSCDSLQVYRGLDVGSAKPTAAERARVPHHLLDVVAPDGEFSAAQFASAGRQALAEIAKRRRLPILVGGSGLYFRALMRGLFEGPERDPALRSRLEAIAARFGDARLHRWLRHVDAESADRIPTSDRLRVVRALEVLKATGLPLSEHLRRPHQPLTGFTPLVIGLAPARTELRSRVERRADLMLAAGLIAEVQGLLAAGYSATLRPLRAIGYRQAVGVLQGGLTLADARTSLIADTMRYAKRQMTWFRREPVRWFEAAADARAAIDAFLAEPPPSH